MNNRGNKNIVSLLVIFFVGALIACQDISSTTTSSPKGDFRIHLISLSQRVDTLQADEKIDILNNPQYIITDEQIESYNWSQQLLVFDDSVQEKYVNAADFLSWPSSFAIIWNEEVIAEGVILDPVSPWIPDQPVIYVVEPKNNPSFSASSSKLVSNVASDTFSVKNIGVLLMIDGRFRYSSPVSETVFDNNMAKDIEEYFRQSGRLID